MPLPKTPLSRLEMYLDSIANYQGAKGGSANLPKTPLSRLEMYLDYIARHVIGELFDLGITGASVGDFPKAKTVDENGAPTEWESGALITSATSTSTDDALTPASLNNLWVNLISNCPVLSETSAYTVGALARKDYNLMRCKTAIPAGGETYNPNHWETLPTLLELIDDCREDIDDLKSKYNPDPKDSTMVLRVGVDSAGRLWASGDIGSERLGVSGVGGSSTSLTRLWDATGLTATPGTDAAAGHSDFDQFPVFNRKKCVGSWSVVNSKAVFTPQAYAGDADYTEDGTMGDYVAVDVPPTYWYHDEENGILGISGSPHPGWEPHPICLDANNNVRPHTYLPCYAMALKDGHAVSLPGYQNFFGCYKDNWDKARTYGDGSAFANFAIIEPSVVDHYEWLMQTIEFATTDMQTVMQGATAMAYDASHTITRAPAANKLVLTAAIGEAYVVGQSIYIGAAHNETPSGVSAYNCITAIEKCDSDGTPNNSGSYRLVTYDGTDRSSSITAGTTKLGSRPWITGATQGYASGVSAVLGHTGSPVSNFDAKHPMLYRWRENTYGNQNVTCLDLFNARTADGNSYHLDWYYNDQLRYQGAALYYPSSTSKPELADLKAAANGFRKLSTTTPVGSYVDGYIKEEGFDADLPCIHVPTLTKNGSATTYYADFAYLVYSLAVRAVRRRGSLYSGRSYGPRFVTALYAPSYLFWSYGAGLYFVQ